MVGQRRWQTLAAAEVPLGLDLDPMPNARRSNARLFAYELSFKCLYCQRLKPERVD